ncbi:hypothetical protein [Amorphus sp. 3PC139-8]|uniref:hypothetical protein n=1 Tax=Amorphus sp. 3PC139-8 TaxID=2735676 RepID=UPI00345D7457
MSTKAFLTRLTLAALLTASAASAYADDVRPLDLALSGDTNRNYAVTVSTRTPRWWIPKVGTDLNFQVAAPPIPSVRPGLPPSEPTGAVWSSLTLPGSGAGLAWDSAKLEFRVDPSARSSTINVSTTRTWAIGARVSASFTDTYSLVRNETSAEADWGAINAFRVDYKPSGTAFVAENLRSIDDDDWHTNLRAEQALGFGLSVSASVSNVMSEDISRTVLASFSRTW